MSSSARASKGPKKAVSEMEIKKPRVAKKEKAIVSKPPAEEAVEALPAEVPASTEEDVLAKKKTRKSVKSAANDSKEASTKDATKIQKNKTKLTGSTSEVPRPIEKGKAASKSVTAIHHRHHSHEAIKYDHPSSLTEQQGDSGSIEPLESKGAQIGRKKADVVAASQANDALAGPSKSYTELSEHKVKILVLYYSMYGHVAQLAKAIYKGARSIDVDVTLKQVPEILSDELLQKKHAVRDGSVPEIAHAMELTKYDGFIFGFPTNYGVLASQFKSFWETTTTQWIEKQLVGKFVTTFTSTAGIHGGQETTHLTSYPLWAHHGMIIVPTGFVDIPGCDADGVRGCSAYGASTIAGSKGEREPTEYELRYAEHQGAYFSRLVSTYVSGSRLKK